MTIDWTGKRGSLGKHKHSSFDIIDETTGDVQAAVTIDTATPALTLGTTNAQGSATSVIATDATILAFDATNPTTQAFGDSAAVGTATTAARRDHKHAMPDAFTYLDTTEGAVPSTPASGKVRVYAKSDGRIYSMDDGGVEHGPFSSGGGTLTAYPAAIMALSPVGYWRLNQTVSARAAIDSSGNGLHAGANLSGGGSINPASALIVGDATAGSFNFSPNVGMWGVDNAAIDVGDVFTIMAVIRADDLTGNRAIFSRGGAAFCLKTSGTNLRLGFDAWQVIADSTGVTLATGTIYHVAATKDGSSVHLYVNGIDRTGSVSNSTMGNTSEPFCIGNLNADIFDGCIAEVALFGTALSSTNISDLFTATGL